MANHHFEQRITRIISGVLVFGALCALSIPSSHAIPVFARQTGQNCLSCHAGGQFPELTPYGRLFKLTGYTMGSRTVPLAMMAVLDATKVRENKDSSGAKIVPKQGSLLADFGSIFLAGKITDNLGLFSQITASNYDHTADDGSWKQHTGADNSELRYADRFISPDSDLIVGAFANNNPTMQDVWNSTSAWGYPYIAPNDNFWLGAPAGPLLDGTLAQNSVGAGVYAYWNKSIYGELSLYRTANGPFSFLHPFDNSTISRIKDGAPYWRFAYTKEWGANNIMVGTSGMVAKLHEANSDGVSDSSLPTDRYEDYGLDAQYEYLLDPHTVTAHASYMHEKTNWGSQAGSSNSSDTLNELKLKGAYVYKAKYGASLSYDQITGSTDANLYGNPDTTSWTPEVFWTPVQYLRVGLQYWHFTKFNGASSNYDGNGRNASDNDTLFFYLWGAY